VTAKSVKVRPEKVRPEKVRPVKASPARAPSAATAGRRANGASGANVATGRAEGSRRGSREEERPRSFESRPPKIDRIDPDNPFAALLALKDKI
jgi:ATP-dependent RNA helicase SUPV3L1/SUV3